jgi:hypothetical protein
MYEEGIDHLAGRVSLASGDSDKLCRLAYREGAPLEVTQALLVASWSLRSAKIALQLAAKQYESNGTLGPSPSSSAATGG